MANAGTMTRTCESWLEQPNRFSTRQPVSIYEVHLGSWMRVPEENNRVLTARELAPKLADYTRRMGYTHVQILDAAERNAHDLTYLIGYLQQRKIEAVQDHAGFTWDPGFAHDIRAYLAQPPGQRKLHHNRLTFRRTYAFQQNYILPLSHEERGILANMPGDEWQKFANLRLLLAYMFLQPGKKLLFMGHDFGQWREWNADMSIDWHLTHLRYHQGTQGLVRRLNDAYYHERALHEGDAQAETFEWVDCDDAQRSIISWLRWDAGFNEVFLAVFNFTPTVYRNFKIGVPRGGEWREVINTDAKEYGGSGQGNFGNVKAAPFGWHGRPQSLFITVPPLAAVAFKSEERN
jgi:1,4-alpha-glucan branching enzyme